MCCPFLRTTPHQHECLNSNPSFEAVVHKTANKSNFFTKHKHKVFVKFQTMMALTPTQKSLSTSLYQAELAAIQLKNFKYKSKVAKRYFTHLQSNYGVHQKQDKHNTATYKQVKTLSKYELTLG